MTKNSTKERIENILIQVNGKEKLFESALGGWYVILADALISAGLCFKKDVGIDEDKLLKIIDNPPVHFLKTGKLAPIFNNMEEYPIPAYEVRGKEKLIEEISKHAKNLLTFEKGDKG